MRDLVSLPKAHLHLHFTGSMRTATLRELADEAGLTVPPALLDDVPDVPADVRGWFRFQRLYEAARGVVTSEPAMRRVLREAVADDAAEGSRRLEIQVDPTSYAPHVGGLVPALEIVLDEARTAARETGMSVGVIVASSRLRHPLDARTLARLASRYAGDGPGEVIGFGLSNDERRGTTSEFAAAFAIAARAGLASVPHGGELLGPEHVRDVVTHLRPHRLGHGVRAAEDPALLEELARSGVACEVCPASNVSLGVYSQARQVPLATLLEAGVPVALGADDPLLFGSRLVAQYEAARAVHGLGDADVAALARSSISASLAPAGERQAWLREVDDWLAASGP